MKRLKFKNPLNGLDNAKKLIPESYKVDGKEFEMTDGNETYKLKWETSIREATVLASSDKVQINEDLDKMKHLMGYSSKETLGTVKGSARLDENIKFNDVLGKSKSLIKEMTGGMGFTGENNFEDEVIEEEVNEEEVNEGDDVNNLLNTMGDSAPVTAAGKKINTNTEKIDATVELGKKITGDDERLMGKAGSKLKNPEETDKPEDTSMTNEELDRFDEIFDGFDNDADDDDSIVDDKVEVVD